MLRAIVYLAFGSVVVDFNIYGKYFRYNLRGAFIW